MSARLRDYSSEAAVANRPVLYLLARVEICLERMLPNRILRSYLSSFIGREMRLFACPFISIFASILHFSTRYGASSLSYPTLWECNPGDPKCGNDPARNAFQADRSSLQIVPSPASGHDLRQSACDDRPKRSGVGDWLRLTVLRSHHQTVKNQDLPLAGEQLVHIQVGRLGFSVRPYELDKDNIKRFSQIQIW